MKMSIERLSACALVVFALLALAALPAHAQSPAFRVDPYWPKPLPNNWIIGQIGGISIDAQDNIWVFQRPRSLTDDEKAASLNPPLAKCCVPAPSVLVFNQAGDVVKSWGGPADNLGYDWPLQEHGILADNKGFVWLSGNGKGDNMVLKFTTDGKFVKQIGKRGPLTSSTDLEQFGQVAALEIDKDANEIYAADGYGNHRVAVMDADTGVIKRVWGAYGKPPTDEPLPAYNAEFAAICQSGPLHSVEPRRPRLYLRPHQQSRAGVSQGRQLRPAIRIRSGHARDGLVMGPGVLAARPEAEFFRAGRRQQRSAGKRAPKGRCRRPQLRSPRPQYR